MYPIASDAAMNKRTPGYIAVDELLPQVTLEQTAAFYGTPLPELHKVGAETRTRCFLQCGRTNETGDRTLAIQTDHPAKQWHCHNYGCGKGGNLVSLCDLMKPGSNDGGRPRGERFKEIALDLRAMVQGTLASPDTPAPSRPLAALPPAPRSNVPLRLSENERARGLIDLDRKFLTDPAQMPPKAAAYFRRRPFFTSEACKKWRMGYLPRGTGEDKSGGTMRGLVVYPLLNEAGDVLTWFGRDPEFEDKHARWVAGGRAEREPEKFHFVKGFHRGLELFGQHGALRLQEPGYRERMQELGVVVVEGPNDVIALDSLGVPAVGLCSNTITDEQATKIARWAQELGGGVATVMLDCDDEGDKGSRQAVYELAQRCQVRLAWSPTMHGGRFKGRQPETVSAEEWALLRPQLDRP